jgi:hypothetical protein
MAAWLASLTRLASCSWRSASHAGPRPLRAARSGRSRTGAASRRPPPSMSQQRDHRPIHSPGVRHRSPPPCGQAACCRRVQAAAQRFAVGHDGCLRLARRHQALQVAQDRGGVAPRVCSYCCSSSCRRSRVASSRVPGRRSSGLPPAARGPADVAKELRSLPSRNTASALTPSVVRNSLAALADALGQHDQLAERPKARPDGTPAAA